MKTRRLSCLVTGSPLALVEYLWTFDSTFQDISTTFSAAPMNNATFSSTSITGYGSSLSLSSSAQQSVNISSPPLKLFNQSWTFEAWIYLANTSATNPSEYSIIGQCNSLRKDECLHLVVRNQTLHLGYYSDDLRGASKLSASRWHHVAFVFDCATRNQSVYLDGFIDGSREATVCFQGHAQSLTIGAIEAWSQGSLFDGLIDQLSFTNRSKTSDEILHDATLTVYFSFDHNSTYDQGPLRINGSLIGNVTFTAGRIGQALEIPNVNQSYIQVPGLVLLGTSNRSYSFSIWIQPYLQQQAAIVQAADILDTSGWYLPLLALTTTSQLVSYSWDGQLVRVAGPVAPANDWTHVAVTYSLISGLHLYVNGTLIDASMPFSFLSSGTPIYLLLGNPDFGGVCSLTFDSCGPYVGAVDEFRLYSRELTPVDVVALANP